MKRLLFALIVTALLLAACAPAALRAPEAPAEPPLAGDLYRDAGGGVAGGPSYEAAPTAGVDEQKYNDSTTNGVAGPAAEQERLVIQNANLSMIVKDPRVTMEKIQGLAKAMGGYLVSSNLYDTYSPDGEKLPQATIVVRVPEERVDEALKQIKADAIEPPTETRSGQDVTQAYVDLESRLRNLESAERQLTQIMNDAVKTEDVLNVFNQLTAVQEQIELVKGQMQYYEESAAFSEISTQLVAQESLEPIKVGGWTPQGALGEALQALVRFFQGVVDFLIIFAVYWLPVLIIFAIPFAIAYFIIRAIVRRRSRKSPPAEPLG